MKLAQKKHIPVALALVAALLLCGCGQGQPFDASLPVTVVSREDGSGTRGAFVELFGLEAPGPGGTQQDTTTLEAVIINNTAVMMNTVSQNRYAIGYLSIGSLNSSIKPVKIDGTAPTAENILNGSYTIARPFLVATSGPISAVAQDFLAFILSADGQGIVSTSGYIPLAGAAPYTGQKPAGKVVVAGSSSVAPVMEKLREAYITLNPSAAVEVQQSDSSTGLSAVREGICDIGMASRALKDSELGQGLIPTVIAMDGIAVVVHPQNPVASLTKEEVRQLFSGQKATWEGLV